MDKLSIYIILFMIYSFIGWIMEVIMIFFAEKKLINRGFFIGPICPIYGFGGLLLTILLSKYVDEALVLFVLSMTICALLEYFTSWALEKIFNLRWWDYSHNTFNINGRVCLETMIPFGIGGTIMVKHINPLILLIINKLSTNTIEWISIIFIILFALDLVVSICLIFNFKSIVKTVKKDSTEDIKNHLANIFNSNNKNLYNRLLNAFPRLQTVIKNSKEKLKKKVNEKNNH